MGIHRAELGAMYPHAGGDYVYLREAFHPLAGFLVGWITFFVIYAGTIATLAAAFADGLASVMPLGVVATRSIAVALVIATSALNYVGVRWGARANNVTALLKVVALVALGVLGPLLGEGSLAHLEGGRSAAGSITWMAFGMALSPVLFSYLGWNSSVYVASEIRDPGRNLPRSLFLGLAICTVVYLMVNAVYIYALSVESMAGEANAGQAAAQALFGGLGGTLVAFFVLASVLGTLNATVLVGPRIAYAMALDGLFFRGVDRAHATFATPSVAIVLQAVTASLLVVSLGTFEAALNYTTFAILLATAADVAALYRLRRIRAERPRPYRAWGYPWVPAVYFVVNLGIALALLVGRPLECVAGLGLAATGIPFYRYFASRAAGQSVA
jgi:APA family basic amino acid/polyamine antiporter